MTYFQAICLEFRNPLRFLCLVLEKLVVNVCIGSVAVVVDLFVVAGCRICVRRGVWSNIVTYGGMELILYFRCKPSNMYVRRVSDLDARWEWKTDPSFEKLDTLYCRTKLML